MSLSLPPQMQRALESVRTVAARVHWWWVLGGVAAGLMIVATVAPLRTVALNTAGRVVILAASPLAPDIGGFDKLEASSVVLDAEGNELVQLDGGERREPVKIAELPEHVVHAVLAAEDARFYEHEGVDAAAVIRALWRSARGDTQGGSTITQQLAKINYTSRERTALRKLREVLYVTKLEERYSKDQLLERYFNQVYFGDGAYGIAAAADVYFGVSPAELTPAQAATLAGRIRRPEGADPREQPDEVTARRDSVLQNMKDQGWLTEAAFDEAVASPLDLAPANDGDPLAADMGPAPHFVEYVKREAETLAELGATPEARQRRLLVGGLTVETTLDLEAFEAARRAVDVRLNGPGDPSAAVVSVQPGDGAIRVLFGGLDPSLKFDLASQGQRQPGSAFKPFVYLAAIRDGIHPRSMFEASAPMDLEYRGERYTVHNYEGETAEGRITLAEALRRSVNTVFAQLVLEVNPGAVVTTAKSAGISTELDAYPSIALGGLRRGVAPLEMAEAYATFAAEGRHAEPYAIRRILDADGEVLFQRKPKVDSAFAAAEVGVLNAGLVDVVRGGTGRAAAIGRPVAGKTGTAQDHTDAWFVGFTPQLATAVWVGHPDGLRPMTNVRGERMTGGAYPAQIFAETMRVAMADEPALRIPVASPDSLNLRELGTAAPNSSTSTSSTTSTTSATSTSTTLGPNPQPSPPSTTRDDDEEGDRTTTTTTTATGGSGDGDSDGDKNDGNGNGRRDESSPDDSSSTTSSTTTTTWRR